MNISLYKIKSSINLNDVFKYLKEENYSKTDQKLYKNVGIYLFVELKEREPTNWQIFLQENFNFPEIEQGQNLNSILIFKVFSSLYIVPFGRAYNSILNIIDFEFGMNFAERQIINEKITAKKINYYLQNKVRELTTFNNNWIEAPLPNQSYSEISGGVRKPEVFGNSVTCSDKVKFTINLPSINELLQKIIDIIIETDNTLQSPIINSNIPRIKPITKESLSNELYNQLHYLIQSNHISDVNLNFIGIYEIDGSNELINFDQITFYYKRKKTDNIINIPDFEKLLPILKKNHYDLRDIKIEIDTSNKDVKRWSIWKILDISIKYNNNIYIHEKNKWYYINNSFVDLLESQLKEIPIHKSSLTFSKKSMNTEDDFIEDVSKHNSHLIKLHKKFIKGNISAPIELADLYDVSAKELYAVKMGLKTSDSIYSLQQSILSLSVLNDKENYDFSNIIGLLPNKKSLQDCKNFSILWPLSPKKTKKKYLTLYDNNKLTLDKLGSMLLKLKISEWYNVTSSYGYNPKIYIVR